MPSFRRDLDLPAVERRPRDLNDWLRTLHALGWSGKRSGAEWSGPCPRCGGKDRFHLRPGDRAAVLVGCRGGCRFEDLREALFPREILPPTPTPSARKTAGNRPMKRRSAPERPAGHAADPGRAGGDSRKPERPSLRGGLLARRLIEAADLSEPARRWIRSRGLDADRLHSLGWRSLEPPWPDALDGTGFERWPWRLHEAQAVAMPYRDRAGRLQGVRFRTARQWRARRRKAPKVLSMPGARAALYGVDRLAAFEPGGTLHVAEGETDAESLLEVGAPAVGLPGASALRGRVVALARRLRARRVVLWLDDDDAGNAGGTRLRDALSAAGIEVLRLRQHGGDVNDLLRADKLRALVADAEA